jgi:hypothetical protein
MLFRMERVPQLYKSQRQEELPESRVKLAFEVMTARLLEGETCENVEELTQILPFDKAVFDCSTNTFTCLFLITIIACTVE